MRVKNIKKINRQSGAAMLISIIFFLFISLAIVFGLVSPTVRAYKSADTDLKSKKSYFLSESGVEDMVYRNIQGMTVDNSEVITLDSNSVTTSTTTLPGGGKEISALGDISSYQRRSQVTLTTGAGIAFNYGLQSGTGGVTMNGGSSVNGNIYSNGNINATTGVSITGTAVAASNATLISGPVNDSPETPASSINFRNVSGSQDFAQSFQATSASPMYKIQLYIKKVGSPQNATIRLVTNNNGSPSTTTVNIGSVSLNAGQVTTNYGWLDILLPTQPSLTAGTTYWIVVDSSSQNANNYFTIGANNTYTSGAAKTGQYSGTWNVTSLDGYFRVYTMDGVTSLIGGDTWVGGVNIGSAGVGDAWATVVQGANVAGTIYCQAGYYNNKACDTSRGSPPPVDMPYSDANIQTWKDEGTAGGIITGATQCPGGSSGGNCTVDWRGASFGPGKITGNLVVNGGGTLTITGTVYVVGTITVTGGGKIKLPSNFADLSATIISDGRVTLSGGSYTGSGVPGSYVFVVSTSTCPVGDGCSGNPAINVTGGAGTIAVNAQNGTVNLSGGIDISAAVGKTITATGGAEITYDSGLASPSFQSGPSGGWSIGGWGETE